MIQLHADTVASMLQYRRQPKRLSPPPMNERDRVTEVLRAARLLTEPSPEMQRIAAQSTLSLEEARTILDRVGGQPLSEVIIEMRGPKI